jgi:hypothetical protein
MEARAVIDEQSGIVIMDLKRKDNWERYLLTKEQFDEIKEKFLVLEVLR